MSLRGRLTRTVDSIDALVEELEAAGAEQVDVTSEHLGVTKVIAWTSDGKGVVYAVGRSMRCAYVGTIDESKGCEDEPF